mmetsp:Transcript_6017/g.13093  ORF Transcript_6017/g.13093 Transcript_6017/m.13093 type:complete len:507 (+) Transcript_6017:172-1692(+)
MMTVLEELPRKRRRPAGQHDHGHGQAPRIHLLHAMLRLTGILLAIMPENASSFCRPQQILILHHVRGAPSSKKSVSNQSTSLLRRMTVKGMNAPDPSPRPPTPPSKFRTYNVIASAFGLILAAFVTYNLASSDVADLVNDATGAVSAGSVATQNILDAALPTSATDVVAVALGEGIGGLVGVGSAFVLSQAMRLQEQSIAATGNADADANDATKGEMSTNYAITEAVAGFDYFLTRAVASPLLLSIGLDPFLASIGGVLVASIPYELVKLQERLRQRRRSENELMNELLREERDRRRKGNILMATPQPAAVKTAAESVDVSTLKPAVASTEFDAPELITDIIKWLEFDVLKSQFSGELTYGNGVSLPPGIESGVFGFMAALSSQLYLDALYQNTNLGPDEKSLESRGRSASDLIQIYATRCFGTAALFATYDSFKLPVRLAITGLISGGYEACLGSEYFDLCVESIEEQSPSLAAITDGASIQAEFRALIVAYVSLFQNIFGGGIG